jgi:Rps23 Pro-64 3,4-dihydroxylase Tpa1-like proline 4-hydroxylase
MDHDALSWVQGAHRDPNAMRNYRESFAAHPAHLLVLRDFLMPDGAEKISRFLHSEAQYETLYGLYSAMRNHPEGMPNATAEDWFKAAEEDRFYRLRKFVGISKDLQLTANFIAYMKFRNAFNHPDVRRFFMEITGLTLDLGESTFHSFTMQPGDFLRSHDDTGRNYGVAFIMYFTPEWESRFGGLLHMIDPQGKMTRIKPEYNSLILFKVDPRTKHFVAPIEAYAGEKGRATISGWMHKPAAEVQDLAP